MTMELRNLRESVEGLPFDTVFRGCSSVLNRPENQALVFLPAQEQLGQHLLSGNDMFCFLEVSYELVKF